MLGGQIDGIMAQIGKAPGTRNVSLLWNSILQAGLIVGMLTCGAIVVTSSAMRILKVTNGMPEIPQRGFEPVGAENIDN